MKAFLIVSALALLGWNLGYAADAPPIHVIVVWVNEKSGDIEFTEHAGIASSVDRCGQMTVKEVAPHVRDYAKNAKLWTAHILCGISQDHYAKGKGKDTEPDAQDEPEQQDSPDDSRPGRGGSKSSAPL